jgi:hypothetical protein
MLIYLQVYMLLSFDILRKELYSCNVLFKSEKLYHSIAISKSKIQSQIPKNENNNLISVAEMKNIFRV